MTTVLSRKSGGSGGGGGAPSGPAGGDLGGSYPNPTLAAGTVAFDAYAILRDQKAAGTNGGTFTAGDWRTRELNTEWDPSGIVLLAANQFTLQAGSYRILATAPAVDCDIHQLRLRNITDGATTLSGDTHFANSGNTGDNTAILLGGFTIAAAKTFELQHQCGTTRNTDGFGLGSNYGEIEVFAQVEIFRGAS